MPVAFLLKYWRTLVPLVLLLAALAWGALWVNNKIDAAEKVGYDKGFTEAEKQCADQKMKEIEALNKRVEEISQASKEAANRVEEAAKKSEQSTNKILQGIKGMKLTNPDCSLTPDFKNAWEALRKGNK